MLQDPVGVHRGYHRLVGGWAVDEHLIGLHHPQFTIGDGVDGFCESPNEFVLSLIGKGRSHEHHSVS